MSTEPLLESGTEPLLELVDVRAAYGSIEVLHGVDLVLEPGAVVALLGPNGGGKTTSLKVCSGIHPVASGEFRLAGRVVNGVSAAELARMGVCSIPEGRGVFPNLTVRRTCGSPPAPASRWRISKRSPIPDSRFSVSDEPSWLGRCRAVSSRCLPCRVRWEPTRPCYCSTNCRWAWPLGSSRRSMTSWVNLQRRVFRYSLRNSSLVQCFPSRPVPH